MIFLTFIILNSWSADTFIGEGYTSYPNQHNIVCDVDGDVHAVWFKWNGGSQYSIQYQYYTGTQWIGIKNLSTGITQSFNYLPSITSWNSEAGDLHLYALWESNWVSHRGNGYSRIVLREYSSGGWEDTVRFISPDSIDAFAPSAMCDSEGVVHIVWEQDYEIRYRNLKNSKLSDEIVLSNSEIYAAYPAIAIFENKIFVVWEDLRDGNFEIYFKEFDGVKWKEDKRITTSNFASIYPSVCVDSSGIVHIIWQEDTNGGYEISYANYTQGNLNTPTIAVESSGEAVNSSITNIGEEIHLVWSDSRDGDWEIYHKIKSQKAKNKWEIPTRLTYSSGLSANPSIAMDKNGNPYLLFWDTRDGKAKVYFKEKEFKNAISQKHKSVNLTILPNPFKQKVSIKYSSNVNYNDLQFTIHDIAGRLVCEIPINESRITNHEVVWNGKDTNGIKLNSGIYFLKVESQKEKTIEKIVLIR